MHAHALVTAAMAGLLVGGCRERPTSPLDRVAIAAGPTLLVANTACGVGVCVPVEVRAFIPQWRVPGQLPEGMPFMGHADGPVQCLTFPAADTFRVIGVDGNGVPRDTALTVWTPDSAVALLAVVGSGGIQAWTPEFVPSGAAGWSVGLPAGGGSVAPAPAPRCTPAMR